MPGQRLKLVAGRAFCFLHLKLFHPEILLAPDRRDPHSEPFTNSTEDQFVQPFLPIRRNIESDHKARIGRGQFLVEMLHESDDMAGTPVVLAHHQDGDVVQTGLRIPVERWRDPRRLASRYGPGQECESGGVIIDPEDRLDDLRIITGLLKLVTIVIHLIVRVLGLLLAHGHIVICEQIVPQSHRHNVFEGKAVIGISFPTKAQQSC